MMKRTALALILVAITAGPALAQGKGKNKQKAVPPGHVPPAGLCRVWYDGVPPGRQPAPTSCYEAERIASQTRNARVVYGGDSRRNDGPIYRDQYPNQYPGDVRRDDGRSPSTDGRRPNTNGRTTGRTAGRDQYPNSYPYPDSRDSRGNYASEAFRKGYDDGVFKGREDVDDRDSFDPARHSWYRSADRGYSSRYGSKEQYRAEYRRGFLDGYGSAHDGQRRTGSSWWPF
ncbi:MAG: hypothetical protein M3541_21155 [Acidobacteriota bacterium]|nr:hypothetical protein [Acidobacteriota bacterium]